MVLDAPGTKIREAWIIEGTPQLRGLHQGEGADRSEGDDLARYHDCPARVGGTSRTDHVRASRQPTPGRDGREARRPRNARRSRPRLHPPDAEIEQELTKDLLDRTMWIDPGKVEIDVSERCCSAERQAPLTERCRAAQQVGGTRSRPSRGRGDGGLGCRRRHTQGQAFPGAVSQMNLPAYAVEVEQIRRRLEAGNGGYEVVHASRGLEVGVYVLLAPEPDHQQPHEEDELYVVLEGRGVLNVEGKAIPVVQGQRSSSCGRRAPVHRLRGSERARGLRACVRGTAVRSAPDPLTSMSATLS